MRRDVYESVKESVKEKDAKNLENIAPEDLEAIEKDNAVMNESVTKEYKVFLQMRDALADRIEKVEVAVWAWRDV